MIYSIGLQKTGTTTIESALETLGYRVKSYFGLRDESIEKTAFAQALNYVLSGKYDAFSDAPFNTLWQELYGVHPNAKFILTVRDDESWIKSIVRHFGAGPSPLFKYQYGGSGCPVGETALWLAKKHRHYEEVQDFFKHKPDQILTMDLFAGDGWEKLCKFLDKPVPDVPFPHKMKNIVMYDG